MAYNALNNLIDAYIYANGVQAITGQILNGVLKQMVSQLGSGYHLMGVAGPETVPASNDYAMAYFAATAGEYADFGGITLAAGEVAVLLTSGNGSWSKQTIYTVPTDTADLENTAGFITNAVTDLVNYYTKTEVDDTLANYPTLEALATALADYYTKTEIDTILAGYTTNTALASALADYYNKNDIDGLLSVVNAALADRYTKSETDTKLGDYYKKTETYDKDEVDSIVAALSRQEYIVAWDGLAAPDVSAIPAGVTVTYSGTPYTGTLAASASTVNKIYMVWNGVAYDMYGTSQDGGYSWVPMGTTSVNLSQYATKAELSQLQQEVTADISQLEAKVTELAGDNVVLVDEVVPYAETEILPIPTYEGDTVHLSFSGAEVGTQVTIKLRNSSNIDQALFDGAVAVGQESFAGDFVVLRDNVSIVLRTTTPSLSVQITKLVEGGVRQLTEDVTDLQGRSADLEIEVDAIKGKTEIPVLYSDGYIVTNYPIGTTIDISTYTQNASYRCLFMECNPGDIVFLKGQGGAGPRLWAFLSVDYKIVEVSSEINTVTEINLLAPVGSAFVLINDRSGNDSFVLPSNSIDGLLDQGELEKTALNNAVGYPGLTEILKEIIPYNSVQNIPYEISKDDVIVCRYKYAAIGSNLVIKMRDANNADQAIFDGTVASSEGTIIVSAVRDAEKFVILSSNGIGTFVEIYKGGDAAVPGLDSIEQTTTSTEDGGVNVITATLKDGTTENFYIRNGRTGSVGPQGPQGPQGNPASTQDYPFQLENTFNGGVSKALTAEKGKDLYEAIGPIRGSQVVNVLDRGAVRNGDISSIITTIIASFGEDGGVIYVPRGTYYLSSPVLWVSNVHIYGDGAGQTIIKPTYSNAFGSPANTNLENISFRDFTVDGELVPNTSGKAFFFLYVKVAIFKDLEILNTPETGLGVDMFINGVIDNVRCDNCGRSGDLNGNAFGCSGIGIGTGAYERGNESLTISNCHCNNCKQNGIFVERQSGDNPVGTSIIGCTCEGNRNGFGISGCDNVAVIGCTAFNNHHAGFSYDSGTMHNNTPYGIRPKFIACIAKDNGQNIPSGYPLYDNEVNGMGWFVKSNYKGIELVACSSINNLLHGIYSPAGSYGLSVIGGNFEYNGGDGIHLSAPQRFRIEPTLVQYNTGNGLYVTGSASYGFFKNFMVLDNTGKGFFFDSVTRWQVTVGDYIAAGNAGGNTDGI